jgi:UDP-3-O-[3-hydroxymyristoyl] glucosamine N-acyltransferase
MKFTAEQIAGILEGEVIGNPMLKYMCCPRLKREGSLTFFVKPKYNTFIEQKPITIVNKTLYQSQH